MKVFLYILVGLGTGLFSGFFGLGGGIIVIPALIFLFGFTQHMAQGTSLAMMIPPIGILAVLQYYKAGNVQILPAALLCIGFVLGGYLGATMVLQIPETILKRLFGVVLFAVSIKMIFSK